VEQTAVPLQVDLSYRLVELIPRYAESAALTLDASAADQLTGEALCAMAPPAHARPVSSASLAWVRPDDLAKRCSRSLPSSWLDVENTIQLVRRKIDASTSGR
jgi:hypothetical protein